MLSSGFDESAIPARAMGEKDQNSAGYDLGTGLGSPDINTLLSGVPRLRSG